MERIAEPHSHPNKWLHILPNLPHLTPLCARAALLRARTSCEKLSSDFIEKLPATLKIAEQAFAGTPLHEQGIARHIEHFHKYGVEREQYTLDGVGKLVFKEGVETIERIEGDDKNKIKEVVINEGAKVIGGRAFYDCSELTAVSLPSTMVEICSEAFVR
jgi:hypothetical protein